MEKLYIEQKIFKITDHYPIYNSEEEIVYYVNESFRFFLKHYTVSDGYGEELFTIDQKLKVFLSEFDINFATGESVVINQKFNLLKPSFDLKTNIGTINVSGNFLRTDYSVTFNGILIGKINRRFWSLRDVYEIEVHSQEHRDLLIAIMIIVDAVKDQEESSSASSSNGGN